MILLGYIYNLPLTASVHIYVYRPNLFVGADWSLVCLFECNEYYMRLYVVIVTTLEACQ